MRLGELRIVFVLQAPIEVNGKLLGKPFKFLRIAKLVVGYRGDGYAHCLQAVPFR